ncbi:MAG: tetratricopeptide repeat protein [Nitrospirae bacterium]|nr:tetratricopeptide repeat protein [Nitrospirota bacterium]
MRFSKEASYDLRIATLILLSLSTGALIVIILAFIKDARDIFVGWRVNRQQKREAKIQEDYNKAIRALLSKKNQQAVPYFQKVLFRNPNHIDALLHLGDIYRLEKNYTEAVHYHQRAKNAAEANIEVLFALVKDYEEASRYDDAIKTLNSILEIDKTNIAALLHARDIFQKMGRWEDAYGMAVQILKAPLSIEEREAERKRMLGIKYELGKFLSASKNLERALKIYRGIIKLDKNFIPAYIGLCDILLGKGDRKEAIELLEDAYSATRSVIVLHKLEDVYLSIAQPEGIISFYQNALNRDPNNLDLKFFLGKLYYRLEMIDDAFEILSEIDPTDKNLPDLHKIVGNIYLRKSNPAAAAEEFRKAMNLSKQVVVPYFCNVCDYHSNNWTGKCPRCGTWNSYIVNLEKTC